MRNRGKEKKLKKRGKRKEGGEGKDEKEGEEFKRRGKKKVGKKEERGGCWCCEVNANNAVIWFRSNVKKNFRLKESFLNQMS